MAPIPGETKVWQYIALMKRILLIDCPGVVPPNPNDSEEEILLRGVVRVENVDNPAQYVAAALKKCKLHHIDRTYGVNGWASSKEFLEMLSRKSGRLLKGGEPDLDGVAKMVINDFLRGKIPWYTSPPFESGMTNKDSNKGKNDTSSLIRKRKRDNTDVDDDEVKKQYQGLETRKEAGIVSVKNNEDSFEVFSDSSDEIDDAKRTEKRNNGVKISK